MTLRFICFIRQRLRDDLHVARVPGMTLRFICFTPLGLGAGHPLFQGGGVDGW